MKHLTFLALGLIRHMLFVHALLWKKCYIRINCPKRVVKNAVVLQHSGASGALVDKLVIRKYVEECCCVRSS